MTIETITHIEPGSIEPGSIEPGSIDPLRADVTCMAKEDFLMAVIRARLQQSALPKRLISAVPMPQLHHKTRVKVDNYLNKALALIGDDEVAPDYNEALSAVTRNPLLSHSHWSVQLQLTARHHQRVMDYYDFVDAATVAKVLYSHWQVKQPQAAIAKQAQRKTLLFIETDNGKLYPAQQFDLSARSPTLLSDLKPLMVQGQAQNLTHMELLHWLCAPVECTLPTANPTLEKHLSQKDYEAALAAVVAAGPSKTSQLLPIEVARQGNHTLFAQMLSQWLSQAPVVLSDEQKQLATEHLKAQMMALGINELSLNQQDKA